MLWWLCLGFFVGAGADNFPSLLSTNATLAVVIDREYLGADYTKIKEVIESYLVYAKREILRHGGVNVQFYSWSSINARKDVTAVLSIASCADTWRLFGSSENLYQFHMAISESDCPRLPQDQAITVPLVKKGEELSQLMLDLRTSGTFKWHSIVIIYDDTLGADHVTRLVKSFSSKSFTLSANPTAVSLLKINVTTNNISDSVRHLLSQISVKTVGRNFLAIVSLELAEILVDHARALRLTNTINQWMYVISDTDYRFGDIYQFKRVLREGDNVAFVYNSTVTKDSCLGGMECQTRELLGAFTRALDEAFIVENETSFQVSDEEWEAIRPTKLDRRNALLRSVKIYLAQNGECDNCTTWSLKTGDTWGREYQQNITNGTTDLDNSSADLITVGTWRPSDGATVVDELFPHNPPWQIITLNESGTGLDYTGLIFDVVKELSRILNFTYTVDVVGVDDSLKNGYINSTIKDAVEVSELVTNFIPSSILDMVRNKSVAFGACAFTISEDYKKLVNFTNPISTQSYTFISARPRELSRALLFMSPFSGDTWFCLAAAIVAMGPILYYVHRSSPVYEYKGISKKGGLSSIENCIWYMYGALLQQGGMHLPYADSARLLVGAWWLVVLVVATTYCGNLVAFLTFPKIDVPITTIEDLLAHRDTVTWSMIKGSFLETQLMKTDEPRFKKLYEGRLKSARSRNFVKNIEEGKHVFIDWKIRLQFIMKKQFLETDRCDLVLAQEDFFDEQLAMLISQDSPYLEIINAEIKKLHQVGLIQKWLLDYLPKKNRCWKNRHIIEVNNHTVNMDDMQGSFFVLFLGFILSLLIIITEKLWHRHSTKKKREVIHPFTT